MRLIEEQITQYAAYHRDRRNLATHFVGVPMIVFSVLLAAAVPAMTIGEFYFPLAVLLGVVASIYYLWLDAVLGVAMVIYVALNVMLAQVMVEAMSNSSALWCALGIFVLGWVIQFFGHWYEGMKPAFFDDVIGLVIAPIFLMTEVFFALGLKPTLRQYVEQRVGPVVAQRVHVQV